MFFFFQKKKERKGKRKNDFNESLILKGKNGFLKPITCIHWPLNFMGYPTLLSQVFFFFVKPRTDPKINVTHVIHLF